MTTYFINTNATDTATKVSEFLKSIGFTFLVEAKQDARVPCVKIDVAKKLYRFLEFKCGPVKGLMSFDELKQRLASPTLKPSYEWLEKQCTTLKKQLSALGYEDHGGGMMAPPLGKPPEYILNDLSPEQAIQAFKDGKSVTVAGKPMTSGTTIEELLDSRLTLKHKRFGRIVLTDQITDAPEVGSSIWAAGIDGKALRVNYHETLRGEVINGLFHLTEQGAIDHVEEMARLNRDGFVEMDVDWLVKLKNELSTVLYSIEEKQLLEASRRIVDVMDEIFKKIGEFY